jgi:hypothetical protein
VIRVLHHAGVALDQHLTVTIDLTEHMFV